MMKSSTAVVTFKVGPVCPFALNGGGALESPWGLPRGSICHVDVSGMEIIRKETNKKKKSKNRRPFVLTQKPSTHRDNNSQKKEREKALCLSL
jgi:hypothetical protein